MQVAGVGGSFFFPSRFWDDWCRDLCAAATCGLQEGRWGRAVLSLVEALFFLSLPCCPWGRGGEGGLRCAKAELCGAVELIVFSGRSMGCGASSPELAAQSAQSKAVDKELKKSQKVTSQEVKILLLGSGASGKSTVAKQMKLLYLDGFSEKEAR